jgi:hypothetical protein
MPHNKTPQTDEIMTSRWSTYAAHHFYLERQGRGRLMLSGDDL